MSVTRRCNIPRAAHRSPRLARGLPRAALLRASPWRCRRRRSTRPATSSSSERRRRARSRSAAPVPPIVTRWAMSIERPAALAARRSPAMRLTRIIGHPPAGVRGPRQRRRPAPFRRPHAQPASSNTCLNGLKRSTGASKRSCRASAKPSTREAPPLSTMRSMWSSEAVPLKKSKVFSIFEQDVVGHRAQRGAPRRRSHHPAAALSSAARHRRSEVRTPSARPR